MYFIELFFLAVGLAMDTFAVSICAGLSRPRAVWKSALVLGLYFGIFQAAMPVFGYLLAVNFADIVVTYTNWIAFALLVFIGGKMILGGLKKDDDSQKTFENANNLGPAKMLPLAIATSIDAMAAGVSFALLQVRIVPAVLLIGAVTFVFSFFGVKIGGAFGARFKSVAEFIGGAILILIGLRILLM